MVLSKLAINVLFLSASCPNWPCKRIPKVNGNTICNINLLITDSAETPWASSTSSPSQSGVSATPRSPDRLALKMAAGIFPLAMETITTEEETVEGSTDKKNIPTHNNSALSLTIKDLKGNTSRGKIIKVLR